MLHERLLHSTPCGEPRRPPTAVSFYVSSATLPPATCTLVSHDGGQGQTQQAGILVDARAGILCGGSWSRVSAFAYHALQNHIADNVAVHLDSPHVLILVLLVRGPLQRLLRE